MRDQPPSLNELFEATRAHERAASPERERLMASVSVRLAQASVLAAGATVATQAAAGTVQKSGLAALFSGIAAKVALGVLVVGLGAALVVSRSRSTAGRAAVAASGARFGPGVSEGAAPRLAASSAAQSNGSSVGELTARPLIDAPVGEPSSRAVHAPTPSGATARGVAKSGASASATSAGASASATSAGAGDSLSEELRLIRAAQGELAGHRPASALSLLERYFKAFPAGTLSPEARATRVRALCASGRVTEAEREAARLAQSAPDSPLATRTRGCSPP